MARPSASHPASSSSPATQGDILARVAPSASTPESLALRAQAGDKDAFNTLVRLFHERLFNFLLRRVRDTALAEDLTQDAFVRAWERLRLYDPAWRFSTWLFTIATRLSVSDARRSARRPAKRMDDHADFEDRKTPSPDDARRLDQQKGSGDTGRLWALAAQHLRDEQHTALWLRYVEDLSIGEIAQVLRKSEVSVRVSLFRARQTLADVATREGLHHASAGNDDESTPSRLARADRSARVRPAIADLFDTTIRNTLPAAPTRIILGGGQ